MIDKTEARRRYDREWRKKNKDKIARNQANYWERRAKKLEEDEARDKYDAEAIQGHMFEEDNEEQIY